jgi:hypothetical protein
MKQSLFIKIHNNIVTNKKMAVNPLSANLIDAHCCLLNFYYYPDCDFFVLFCFCEYDTILFVGNIPGRTDSGIVDDRRPLPPISGNFIL